MSIEIQREGAVAFAVPLPRALFRDVRLTFSARGLFAFLWDLPEGWVLRLDHLVKMGPEGRDALRARLRELEQVGAVRIEAIRADGGRVAGKRWILIAADRWAIEAPLARKPLQDGSSTEERVSRSSVKPIIGKPDTKVSQGVKVLQAAAPHAPARGHADAAAPQSGKRRTKRASGIVTWMPDDLLEAVRIEQQHSADVIGAAVSALLTAGKQPVPGLVAREIERQRHEHIAAERRAVIAQQLAAADALALDPTVAARAEQLYPAIAGMRRKSTTTHEATS
ncbi:MAG: hypothetical protein Q7S46_08490 [Gallionella sp.]|nr:hypothetical protein [Gallionella sp.]